MTQSVNVDLTLSGATPSPSLRATPAPATVAEVEVTREPNHRAWSMTEPSDNHCHLWLRNCQ